MYGGSVLGVNKEARAALQAANDKGGRRVVGSLLQRPVSVSVWSVYIVWLLLMEQYHSELPLATFYQRYVTQGFSVSLSFSLSQSLSLPLSASLSVCLCLSVSVSDLSLIHI